MPLCMRATKCRINTHDPIRLRSSFRVEGISFVRDSITRFPQACLSSSRFREGAAWNASHIAALAKKGAWEDRLSENTMTQLKTLLLVAAAVGGLSASAAASPMNVGRGQEASLV